MIVEAAYWRAQKRGLAGGDATQEWLDAEAEIDALLLKTPTRRPRFHWLPWCHRRFPPA
ncbi:MAG: DUF2934 domain-containing protein [Betaproteobacteria bacterium]|nr:DUF2934 domain-containing protein [Betaproteobacteria bacterium]